LPGEGRNDTVWEVPGLFHLGNPIANYRASEKPVGIELPGGMKKRPDVPRVS
jgi:hypothetical protein